MKVRSLNVIILAVFLVSVYIIGLNQQKREVNNNLNKQDTEQESKTDADDVNVWQEPFLDDHDWYNEIYNNAVELAEEHGLNQFLELKKTWVSEEGKYCAYFAAEYSDSGVYLEAGSMEIYELVFKDSIYTEGFAGMDYRLIDVDEQKAAMLENIILRNGVHERCTLYSLDDKYALINTASDTWYNIDIEEEVILQVDIGEEMKIEAGNWNFCEAWWNSYQEVLNNWTNMAEYEKKFAETIGGLVRYDPVLLDNIGKDLVFERYALYDLDKNGVPELILLSDHDDSMNAVFTYTDKLVYCGTYYNALYTSDGKIIERGSWFGGSAMLIAPWKITEIKEGEIIGEENVWGEYKEIGSNEVRYMRYMEEEYEEISYEEYCDLKNALLFKADFVRNICSEKIENSNNTANKEVADYIEEQYSANKMQEAYRTILAEYDRVWQDADYTMEKWENVYDITIEYKSRKTVQYTLVYCIKDLADDGIPELIIGAREIGSKEAEGEYEPYVLYTYDGEKAFMDIGRERYFMTIYQDGIVELWGVASYECGCYMYYQIKKGMDRSEYLGELIMDEGNEGGTRFYKEEINGSKVEKVEIEEDEFTNTVNQYTAVKEELEWKPLEGFWKPDNE